MSLSRLYQSALLAHNRAPLNHHEMAHATHVARGTDALCGDDIQVWLSIEAGRIGRASWTGEACAITTAAASMLTEWLSGRPVDALSEAAARFTDLLDDPERSDIPEFGDLNSLRAVGEFPSRRRNALLPWKTALRAVEQGARQRSN